MTNKERRRRNRRKQRSARDEVRSTQGVPAENCSESEQNRDREGAYSEVFSDAFPDPVEMIEQRAAALEAEREKIEVQRDVEREGLLKKSLQIEREIDASFDEGIEGFCRVRQKLNEEFESEQARIQEQFYEEVERVGEIAAQRVLNERYVENATQHLALNAPVWQQLSGLYPNSHREMEPTERRRRIGILLARVEKMMRRGTPSPCGRGLGGGEKCSRSVESAEKGDAFYPSPYPLPQGEGEYNGVLWSPIPEICVYLEIPKRTLSDLSKEATGLSIEQMYDRIKAEGLRGQLRAALEAFVAEWFSKNKDTGRGAPSTADEIYAALKASRRGPRFHRSQWAFELGYSSYQRLFRASQLTEGMTPHQLEIALIEEILEKRARCSGGQNEIQSNRRDAESQRTAEISGEKTIKEGSAVNSAAEIAKAG